MVSKGGVALGFTLLVLLGAIAIPAAVDSVDKTEVESQSLDIGDTAIFDQQIELSLVDATNTEATVRIVDEETGESFDRVIAEGASETFNFSNGNVTVTNSISTNAGATLLVEFPSIFGFSPSAQIVGDNLAIILVAMLFISVMAFVGVKP